MKEIMAKKKKKKKKKKKNITKCCDNSHYRTLEKDLEMYKQEVAKMEREIAIAEEYGFTQKRPIEMVEGETIIRLWSGYNKPPKRARFISKKYKRSYCAYEVEVKDVKNGRITTHYFDPIKYFWTEN